MKLNHGKLVLSGMEFENPLDSIPLQKKRGQYAEWRESERITFRSIWLDRYVKGDGISISFESVPLKISNRGRCFLNEIEIKDEEEVNSIKELFSLLKVE